MTIDPAPAEFGRSFLVSLAVAYHRAARRLTEEAETLSTTVEKDGRPVLVRSPEAARKIDTARILRICAAETEADLARFFPEKRHVQNPAA